MKMQFQLPGFVVKAMIASGLWKMRENPKKIRGSLAGGAINRTLADWVHSPVSADREILSDLSATRARARERARNDPLVRRYLRLLQQNVIGSSGIRLQAQVRNNDGSLNKLFNDKIEAAFAKWSECVTVDGKMSFRALDKTLVRNTAVDGEVFVRIVTGPEWPDGIAVQLIDPDQIDHNLNVQASKGQNEIRLGVEVDLWSRPVAYHVLVKHPSDTYYTDNRTVRVPAEEIIHRYDPERVNQTRGVSWLAPVLVRLRHNDGYVEAELVAARSAACKMGFWEQTDPGGSPDPNAAKELPTEMQPGLIQELPWGYKYAANDPTHPTTAFPDFQGAVLRQASSGLNVSYPTLANDLVGVSYNSLRHDRINETDNYMDLQQDYTETVKHRIYLAWLRSAIFRRSLVLDARPFEKLSAASWSCRGWDWVDPLKDIQAAELGIRLGLTTRSAEVRKTGRSYEEVLEERQEDERLESQYGVTYASAATPPAAEEPEPEDDEEEMPPDEKEEKSVNAYIV